MTQNKKNFLWNTIGSGFNSFNSLFFMIIVTRINGIKDAGIFSLCFATASMLYIIAIYSGRTYQITETDKKAKFITSSFDIEKLKKQKKSFNDIAGAIIYSARPELFSSPKIALLSSLSGYLVAKEIALITNVEFVYNNPLLDKSFHEF